MRRGYRLLSLGATAVTAAALALAVASGCFSPPDVFAGPVALVAVSFAGVGLVATVTRPASAVGPLMSAVGACWATGQFPLPLPFWLVLPPRLLWAAVLAHLVLAFPTGRLAAAAPRLVVAAAYLDVAYLCLLALLGTGGHDTASGLAGTAVTILIALASLALVVRRWWRASATERRLLAPVLGASTPAAVLFIASKPGLDGGVNSVALVLATQLSMVAIPAAYLATLARRRIDRGRVADLVVRLNSGARPAGVQAALAATLHDPDLRVGYWSAVTGGYIDTDGRPMPVAATRTVTRVDRGGQPLAVLVHDPALLDDPRMVSAACAAAALALENGRLTAQLRARVRELAASRSRIVQAVEAERRSLERDLHDGVQQRLLSVTMALGRAEAALTGPAPGPGAVRPLVAEAKAGALAVLAELRALCHGIHPPVLVERGLRGAVLELAAVSPVPVRPLEIDVTGALPAEVETTAYYLVAEAFANVTKHAAAGTARVSISDAGGRLVVEVADDGRGGADPGRGSGLRGLADRVEASGGTLALASPPGGGTRLRAVLPCG